MKNWVTRSSHGWTLLYTGLMPASIQPINQPLKNSASVNHPPSISDVVMMVVLRIKERMDALSPTGKMMLVVMLVLMLCVLAKLGLIPRGRHAVHPNFYAPSQSILAVIASATVANVAVLTPHTVRAHESPARLITLGSASTLIDDSQQQGQHRRPHS